MPHIFIRFGHLAINGQPCGGFIRFGGVPSITGNFFLRSSASGMVSNKALVYGCLGS